MFNKGHVLVYYVVKEKGAVSFFFSYQHPHPTPHVYIVIYWV